ncbi:hypothetical protein PHET_11342 [Paragonimus heterotremus]|uniref:Uncharacterized protein n=1 Tax=Paragonimus heterotremus TaxID=100268 RepID=A0A8J4SKY8_9TREM|nr:hypothetical protein PHET_11342 [Paragonimus heterotremus]
MGEVRSLVNQQSPLPNVTSAHQVTGVHLIASFEEAWSHVHMVDLDESVRTVPMVSQSSPEKVVGNILNSASSNSSNQDVHLLQLTMDMIEKLLLSTPGVDRSPNDDIKSLTCLPFMAPYRTLTDCDTGEVILMSEEKRKTAVLTVFIGVLSIQIRKNDSGQFASKSLPTSVY